MDNKKKDGDEQKAGMSRREFFTKGAVITAAVGGASLMLPDRLLAQETASQKSVIPSKMYLVVDQKKCAGCLSCMLACSMVHDGASNLSSSRIQIVDDAFGSFPNDISIAVCRQCAEPTCYYACEIRDKAMPIDPKTGVRTINEKECTGCRKCVSACQFTPSRVSFDVKKNVAHKCDMCQSTPYWKNSGRQACVEVCPQNAIKFTSEKPVGYDAYNVNLRGDGWKKLGLPTD